MNVTDALIVLVPFALVLAIDYCFWLRARRRGQRLLARLFGGDSGHSVCACSGGQPDLDCPVHGIDARGPGGDR